MFQSIIINLLSNDIKKGKIVIKDFLYKYDSSLTDDGTLWIITRTYIENGELVPFPFEIIQLLEGYFLKNIILVPNFEKSFDTGIFSNGIYYVLFLSKKSNHYFNKDPIREKHIWKDIEWGKREKNYHSLGKDPGNVWLKTQDDGNGKITAHVPLIFDEVIERIIKSSTKDNSKCLLINNPNNKLNIGGVNIIYERL